MKQTVEERLTTLERTTSLGNASAYVDILAAAVRDPSPNVRSKAAQIVAEHQIDGGVPMLEKLLHDRSEQVRIEAVKCIGASQVIAGNSREKLRPLLKDKSFLVRIHTLESLSLLRDQQALPNVARLLADEHPLVRAYSARTIAALSGMTYLQAIRHALESEKEDSARAGLLEALFLLGQKEVLGAFLELLHSGDYRVRCAVANAIESMPLDHLQIESAIAELSQAQLYALGVADQSSIAGALATLRRKNNHT